MKKIILATIISAAMSASVFAAPSATPNQGHGKVTFTGEIIDAPCSIKPESIDQTVPLGQISNTILSLGGTSQPKQFTIELEDCNLDGIAGKVEITFSGANAEFEPKLLGVTGLVENQGNVGIQITDAQGQPIDMGISTTAAHQLQNGENTLQYSAYLVGANVAVDKIPLGKFEGVTNFTLAYN